MFTGIVQERGRVEAMAGGVDGVRLRIVAPKTSAGVEVGHSVALNGVCLTVVEVAGETLVFDAVPETLHRTSLGHLRPSDELNIEPALRAGDPLGGHLMQGHVDGVGRVRSLAPEGEGMRLGTDVPPELTRFCVVKGSIAIQGVSLTIAAMDGDAIEIALVPHTLKVTTLSSLRVGDQVNLEVDVVAKYVERLLAERDKH